MSDGSSKTEMVSSINGEYRPLISGPIWARYDSFSTDSDIDREEYIAGVA